MHNHHIVSHRLLEPSKALAAQANRDGQSKRTCQSEIVHGHHLMQETETIETHADQALLARGTYPNPPFDAIPEVQIDE